MTQHSQTDRILLRKAGLSENTELSPWERSHLGEARAALARNPLISQHRLLSILRPSEDRPPND